MISRRRSSSDLSRNAKPFVSGNERHVIDNSRYYEDLINSLYCVFEKKTPPVLYDPNLVGDIHIHKNGDLVFLNTPPHLLDVLKILHMAVLSITPSYQNTYDMFEISWSLQIYTRDQYFKGVELFNGTMLNIRMLIYIVFSSFQHSYMKEDHAKYMFRGVTTRFLDVIKNF